MIRKYLKRGGNMTIQAAFWEKEIIRKRKIDMIQINIGNRCNQMCSHCHIGASPYGKENMDYATAKKILDKLNSLDIENIEFTGGTPELNPNFRMFIEELSKNNKHITVRTSLTVLDMPEYSYFIDLYKEHKVKVIASFPGLFEDQIDEQRGKGVFNTSIKVLKRLNDIGYGRDRLSLDFVYNPSGDYLPPEQAGLEREYKKNLKDMYNISFDNLITIVNSPIKRFKHHLAKHGLLDDYLKMLTNNFNHETLENLMCRHLVSVDYQGYLYDCDFNLALGIRTKGYEGKRFWEIDFHNFYPEITCNMHCYACTVNKGSSCHGILIKDEDDFDVKENVKKYYGKELQSSADLKTTACCPPDSLPEYVRKTLPYIADEIVAKHYGCGSPLPSALEGCVVLDLGCGTGRDVYIASRLVGQDGYAIGVDMTDEQLDVAKKYIDSQMRRFGYQKPNIAFKKGCIEDLKEIGIEDNSVDVVISNCVVNLSPDKPAVFSEIFRVLKHGGELYFSDVFAGRRIPEHLKADPVLYGECLAGALYIEDFRRLLREVGCLDYRVVEKRNITLNNPEIEAKIGMVDFFSMTIRAFKLDSLEDICEDYGQVALYLGTIPGYPHALELDDHHLFIKGKPMLVCGNTASMLQETRFARHFRVIGERSTHYGPFDCAPASVKFASDGSRCGGACC
jgi:radical SAM/Cys-rich protein